MWKGLEGLDQAQRFIKVAIFADLCKHKVQTGLKIIEDVRPQWISEVEAPFSEFLLKFLSKASLSCNYLCPWQHLLQWNYVEFGPKHIIFSKSTHTHRLWVAHLEYGHSHSNRTWRLQQLQHVPTQGPNSRTHILYTELIWMIKLDVKICQKAPYPKVIPKACTWECTCLHLQRSARCLHWAHKGNLGARLAALALQRPQMPQAADINNLSSWQLQLVIRQSRLWHSISTA